MNEILEEIRNIGIVPVIKIEHEEDACPLAEALIRGGIPCAEVTFRTKAAKGAIQAISERYPKMLVGAGTILTREQVDEAVMAGAKFIVSPGLNPSVVSYCIEKGIIVIPGCCTPSDIERAIELGLNVIKFFPAEPAGGVSMIKALSAPYTNVMFMPTGGINRNNMNNYLMCSKVVACGGSWMVTEELIKEKRFDEITRLSKEAVHTMLNFRIKEIEIISSQKSSRDASFKSDGITLDQCINDFLGSSCDLHITECNQFIGEVAVSESVYSKEDKTQRQSREKDNDLDRNGVELDLKDSYVEGIDYTGCLVIETDHMERAKYHLRQYGFNTISQEGQGYSLLNRGCINGDSEKGKKEYVFLVEKLGGFIIKIQQR